MNYRIIMKLLLCLSAFIALSCCQNSSGDLPKLKYQNALSSASPEASEIGMAILERGGNAADAAIAVTFALNVTEPAMSGIGGGSQIQIRLPDQVPFAINGSTLSPSSTPLLFLKDSLVQHLRTTIPSTVRVMQFLYENYSSGKLSWGELLQPSIDIIENGFSWGPFRSKVMSKYIEKLSGHPSVSSYNFNQEGPRLESLANCFKILAKDGPESFYTGVIAESIDQDMKKNGGWIRLEDLQSFPEPEVIPSVHLSYKGYDIYTQPEPCGGWVVTEILQRLDALSQKRDDPILNLVEAIDYGHAVRKMKAEEEFNSSGETTHFSVMDDEGMCLSVTASINAYYGAGVANPEYGFLYNSYMDDFNFEDPNNKYALGPGKMAYSSMSPSIVTLDGEVVLIIGSPGSARIISTTAQLIDHYITERYPRSDLLNLPRVHAQNRRVYFESDQLRSRFMDYDGWEIINANPDLVRNGLNPYFGGVHAIVWSERGYLALADPRRDGVGLTE